MTCRRRPPMDAPEKLVKWAGTRDPFQIAGMLEIPVNHLSSSKSRLPGLTCFVNGRPSIFINDAYFENLVRKNRSYTEEDMRNDILQIGAHELGHACLHRGNLKDGAIWEYEIFDVRTVMEVEANKFAAAIRIDREELLEYLNSNLTILQIAGTMQVNVNLLIYRIEMLREEGYIFREMPYIPKNNFIGHIRGAASPEWK